MGTCNNGSGEKDVWESAMVWEAMEGGKRKTGVGAEQKAWKGKKPRKMSDTETYKKT